MKCITSAVGTSVIAITIAVAHMSNAFAAPDPVSAESSTPPTQYKSPFKDYRPLGDDQRIPWKAANDEVGKIGGWHVYLREAQEGNKAAPELAPATTPMPSTPKVPSGNSLAPEKPKPGEHAGHGQHK
jgi:hypothetical protein